MYIIKNALRCISRSKGRNILIGIIALVIAVAVQMMGIGLLLTLMTSAVSVLFVMRIAPKGKK